MGEALFPKAQRGYVKIHRWKKYEVNSLTTYTWNRWNLVSTTTYKWNKYDVNVTESQLSGSSGTNIPIKGFRTKTYAGVVWYLSNGGYSINSINGEYPASGLTGAGMMLSNTIYYAGSGQIWYIEPALYSDVLAERQGYKYRVKATQLTSSNESECNYRGQAYEAKLSRGPFIESITDSYQYRYPSNGASSDGYWYMSTGSNTSYSKGSTSYPDVTSTDSNAYPNGNHDGSYWYDNRTSETSYSQGTYITDVVSTDPNAYPANGISGSYWYVYDGVS